MLLERDIVQYPNQEHTPRQWRESLLPMIEKE